MTAAEILAEIAADRRRGASELTRRAVESLRALADEDAGWDRVVDWARQLRRAQPSMAPLFRLANDTLWAGETRWRQLPDETEARIDAGATALTEHLTTMLRGVSAVVTLSRSATVEQALLAAHKAGIPQRIIALESRPGSEGVDLARRLQQAGLTVQLSADAEMYRAMHEAEMALIGGDGVTPSVVVNKVGSAALALAARARERAFVVACGRNKWAGEGWVVSAEDYFETMPLDWVTWVVCESGRMDVASVRAELNQEKVHPLLMSTN